MKIIRLILFALILISPATATAEETDSTSIDWISASPDHYLPAMTRKVNSPKSPCNKGSEPFVNFIKRFRSDSAFRKDRLYNKPQSVEDEEYTESYLKNLLYVLNNIKSSNTADLHYYASWFGVTAEQVCLTANFEYLEDGDYASGSSMFYLFKRIDGRWYLCDFIAFG